jgi:hypothetical protein
MEIFDWFSDCKKQRQECENHAMCKSFGGEWGDLPILMLGALSA